MKSWGLQARSRSNKAVDNLLSPSEWSDHYKRHITEDQPQLQKYTVEEDVELILSISIEKSIPHCVK